MKFLGCHASRTFFVRGGIQENYPRIIFDRDDEVKIIAIEKIKPRGGAYK